MPEGDVNNNGTPWYQPAESLKTTDPETWSHFENGVKSGAITDLPSFIKKGIGAERKLGTALVPPGKDAKPEEITAFRHKVNGGPGAADKYEIKHHESNKALADELRTIAYENGWSQDTVSRLVGAFDKRMGEVKSVIEYDQAATEKHLEEWAKDHGIDGKQAAIIAVGWMEKHVPPEELEKYHAFLDVTGLGSAPWLVQAIAENALYSGESQSFLEGTGGESGGDVDAEYEEVNKIARDPQHPLHAKFTSGDPALRERYDNAYKKKWGTKEV